MPRLLKQSTAMTFRIGPFVDSTDAVTPETGLTIAQADIQISKAGGAFAQTSATTPTTTHDADGWYQCPLTATDTGTLGMLTVQIAMSGALPVWEHFEVVSANIYDSVISGTDLVDVNVAQWNGTALSTTNPLPNAAAGANGGLPTVNASNHIAGVQGTINTLDGLDAAQDTQHGTTQSAIAALNDLDAAGVRTAVGLASANLDTQLGTIDSNVDAVLVDTGTTLETHLTDIKGATFSGATDSLEAIRDRGDAAWTTGAGGSPPQLLQSTTIATLATQVSFTLTAGSADDDAYNGAIVVVTDQSTATQKAYGTVSDYVGATRTVTLSADPGIFTMAAGDSIVIIVPLGAAGSAPTAAQIRSEIDANSTQLAAIVADTNEIQTDLADGGRLDLLVDGIKAVTDALPDSGALTSLATAAAVATVDTNVDAILVDTGTTLPAQIAALNDPSAAAIADAVWDEAQSGHVSAGSFGEMASELALVLEDTGTTIPAQIGALNDLSQAEVQTAAAAALTAYDPPTNAELTAGLAALNDPTAAAIAGAVLTTQMTESYAADGAAPTLTQALMLIQQALTEFTISGTTQTIKRVDGSTTAATLTLNDATSPTGVTRAT